jgi:hypothetical protein
MRSTGKHPGLGLAALPIVFRCAPALANDLPAPLSEPASGREAFLAAAIAAMLLLGLTSFLLFGRVSARTHVALAMLGVLVGAFALFVLFGGLLNDNPLAAVVVLLLLIALFKLMSQFETNRKPTKKD